MLKQGWYDVEMLPDGIYEKANSYEYSVCKFTDKMKILGIL